MPKNHRKPLELFCSYSHKDEVYLERLEECLAYLKKGNEIIVWNDKNILPGSNIADAVIGKMGSTDIFIFLLSPSYLSSDECLREWNTAVDIERSRNKSCVRIPIVIRDCEWIDLLSADNIKALPKDGKSVAEYSNQDRAWSEVCSGIKLVVSELVNRFQLRVDFVDSLEVTEFSSNNPLKLSDIFEFPCLLLMPDNPKDFNVYGEKEIASIDELLKFDKALVHGEDMSGKTALSRILFLSLAGAKSPTLYFDLQNTFGQPTAKTFEGVFHEQFEGSYSLWKESNETKTIIIDGLGSSKRDRRLLEVATEQFDSVIAFCSTNIYRSYYWDDSLLARFKKLEIGPLTHVIQERLIRKRLQLMNMREAVKDGHVDQIESKVNSVIQAEIVPRYPFYVLSIIQTLEAFMPKDFNITSYGHCYYALILARLIKSGIARSDDSLNVCLQFSERLAYAKYWAESINGEKFTKQEFESFVLRYRKTYVLPDSILNRMQGGEYGIFDESGNFVVPYMMFYFLGMYLAKNAETEKVIMEKLCEHSYAHTNHLVLLFTIHHAIDEDIVDTILINTMYAADNYTPSKLNKSETSLLQKFVDKLPKDIQSENDVISERQTEREQRDIQEQEAQVYDVSSPTESSEEMAGGNLIYKIIKNNELLGHILKNRYGRMERSKIVEVIETISEGGLRLVSGLLGDQNEILGLATYLHHVYPDLDAEQISARVEFLCFFWTMINVENIVSNISHKGIRELVRDVARDRNTPAYDIIWYFSTLDSSEELSIDIRDRLDELCKRHDDSFIRKVLSMRTQHYMNTHRGRESLEQQVCSVLGLQYKPRSQPKSSRKVN